jgi:hypothetical protein
MVAIREVEREGAAFILVLECDHRVSLRSKRGAADIPKQARCHTCRPPTCGATNRAGFACRLRPRHDGLHEAGACRWSYDARAIPG